MGGARRGTDCGWEKAEQIKFDSGRDKTEMPFRHLKAMPNQQVDGNFHS